jgi:hypothetical protein
MSKDPKQPSKAGASNAPRAPASITLDSRRARSGITAGVLLVSVLLAWTLGLVALPLGVMFLLSLLVSAMQWLNLIIARRDSAFRRGGRRLRLPPPQPGERPYRLSPHVRGEVIYIFEAFAALATILVAVLLGAHVINPNPHLMVFVAIAWMFAGGALTILFPKTEEG